MSVDPGSGYRLLKVGEVIHDGDEHFNSVVWVPTWGFGSRIEPLHWPHRRKLTDDELAIVREVGTLEPAVPGKHPLAARMEKAIADLPYRAIPFAEILCEAMELHAAKAKDYGSDADPYANIRASEEFGIAAWHGALMRSNDKITRLKQFAKKGVLANESAADSMLDLVVYFAITLMLYREAK